MFSSLKLSNFRGKSKNCQSSSSEPPLTAKPPKTPKTPLSQNRRSKCGVDKALCPGGAASKEVNEMVTQPPPASPSPTHPSRSISAPKLQRFPSDSSLGCRVVNVTLRRDGEGLGINLRSQLHPSAQSKCLVISHVRPGGPADREGSVRVGDRLLAANGLSLCDLSLSDAQRVLASQQDPVVLTIEFASSSTDSGVESSSAALADQVFAPAIAAARGSPSPSSFSTMTTLRNRGSHSHNNFNDSASTSGIYITGLQQAMSHLETLQVSLHADPMYSCFGLTLSPSSSGQLVGSNPPVIAAIEPLSPADLCGVLQPGDRLLAAAAAGLAPSTVEPATVLARECSSIGLRVEFDVADAVVPASGVFTVKLATKRGELGITLAGDPMSRAAEASALISAVRRGSVAHRSGTIQPGDRLLAVDGVPLDPADPVRDADRALGVLASAAADVVTLTIRKDDAAAHQGSGTSSPAGDPGIIYTVELARFGGPLGITIAGSEERYEPITISSLTPGGLAERTGALHVGDRLLAINGESLHGKPLSEAIVHLHDSSDTVTIKIARTSGPRSRRDGGSMEQELHLLSLCSGGSEIGGGEGVYSMDNLPSVDSAVDSCSEADSSSKPVSPENNPSPALYKAESATVRRKQKLTEPDVSNFPRWDESSQDSMHSDMERVGSLTGSYDGPEDFYTLEKAELQKHLLSSHLDQKYFRTINCLEDSSYGLNVNPFGSYVHLSSNPESHLQVFHVTLYKDPVYEDFGFSVSDGLYERGVYINRIRRGGPADLTHILRPYDRILQVNDTKTHDFDCCLTVPLMASANERLELTVARNPLWASNQAPPDQNGPETGIPWIDDLNYITERSPNTITKTL